MFVASKKCFHCRSTDEMIEDGLETTQQFRERWRSIYIIYFTMFLISLGFSIIVTGVWPYLDKLDPTAGKEFMGFVVAANPFGQMIFSPLVGWWSNRLGSIRAPMIVSLVVFTLASIMYSSLELFENNRKYWMFVARLLVGVSSANIAACRSYLSAATRLSERTKAVSFISLAQVLGFVVGPSLQAAVVPLGDKGFSILPNDALHLNMYTAAGWLNAALAVVNIYLFLPSVFKEHNKIAARETLLKRGGGPLTPTNETLNPLHHPSETPNYFAAWTLIVAFFVIVFNFMLLETLGTPVTMDQFAWTKAESLRNMGLLMTVGAVMAVATFAAIAPLCRRFNEGRVMIWGGFLFMVLGRVCYIPVGVGRVQMFDAGFKVGLMEYCDRLQKDLPIPPTLQQQINNSIYHQIQTQTTTTTNFNNNFDFPFDFDEKTNFTKIKLMTFGCGEDLIGCPSTQSWCEWLPAMTITQFVVGYLLTAFGYPIGVTLIQTLFTKVLGTKPQGVWMGLMTGSGCLSRVMGPVFVTYIYEQFGTIWTFGFTTVMMAVCLLWLLYFNDVLVPPQLQPIAEGEREEEGERREENSFKDCGGGGVEMEVQRTVGGEKIEEIVILDNNKEEK